MSSEVARPDREGPFPEIRDALTRKETWIWILGFVAVSVVAFRWPFVWAFSVLCCFSPAPLFCYGAVRSGVIRKPGMMKIVITVMTIHCGLLAATLYLWREFPKSFTWDFSFGFVAIEIAVIWVLMRFPRRMSSSAPR